MHAHSLLFDISGACFIMAVLVVTVPLPESPACNKYDFLIASCSSVNLLNTAVMEEK